ncbi:MAG: quinol:cytochrome C oxidoreductase [Pirellulaceae bacterium]
MHVRQQIHPGEQESKALSGSVAPVCGTLVVVGVVLLTLAVVFGFQRGDGFAYFFHAYLVSFCFYLSISLGGLFFVALQHASRAGWSVAVRRVAEIIAANTLVMAVLFLPVLLPLLWGNTALYEWLNPQLVAADHLLSGKSAYLNLPFFTLRAVAFFAVWGTQAWFFWRRSLEQDDSGDANLTLRMERVSYPALVLFAVTITFAAFDWIMSLTPHWYSTIFGVYYFSGSVVGFLATVILILFGLQKAGHLASTVTADHYHELGKLLFAFIVFWGYIAFSQYMLIWYANLPEETIWYLPRQQSGWIAVSLILLFGHLVIPFFGLMSRGAKRRPAILAFWAVWLLVVHWLDVHYLIMPHVVKESFPLGPIDIGCVLGIGSLFVAGLLMFAGHRPLTPAKDPRLGESLGFENG